VSSTLEVTPAACSCAPQADLVFVALDNGLESAGFSHGSGKAGKSVTLDELLALRRPGRCLIVYHHHTRRAGAHHAEIDHWAGRLKKAGFTRVVALRAKLWSPKVFFMLDAPEMSGAGRCRSSSDGVA